MCFQRVGHARECDPWRPDHVLHKPQMVASIHEIANGKMQ